MGLFFAFREILKAIAFLGCQIAIAIVVAFFHTITRCFVIYSDGEERFTRIN
ncbi:MULTISPECIES: hypothetical protein [Spirulina sp. CCY15215]|uniref:hypothetical protein n=1 Tax=Spirulina sp. CCY15215 TaxID=2767591 RepID=UPI0019519522|nr:hypothetical protein [Spirulina major]